MDCQYCNKEIANKGSHTAHEMSCKLNPERVQHYHSPEAGRKKGCVSWSKGKILGQQKFRQLHTNEEVFVENSVCARTIIRKRILQENMIPYVCAICCIGPEWCGKPMPLILDHINGINNDNRLENLRFVCGHCDSQLPTYKSKNRKR